MYTAEYTLKGYRVVLESIYSEAYLPQQARQLDAGIDLKVRVPAEEAINEIVGFEPELVYVDGKPVSGRGLQKVLNSPCIYVPPRRTKIVPTGVRWRVELPEGDSDSLLCLLLFARSGLAARTGLCLANGVGVVDMTYPEEIMVALRNESEYGHYLHDGCRVAQGVIIEAMNLGGGVGVRTSGFGHTGVVG